MKFFFFLVFSICPLARGFFSTCPGYSLPPTDYCNGQICQVAFIFGLWNNGYDFVNEFFRRKFDEDNLLYLHSPVGKPVYIEILILKHTIGVLTTINFQVEWIRNRTLSDINNLINEQECVYDNYNDEKFKRKFEKYVMGPKEDGVYATSYTGVIFDSNLPEDMAYIMKNASYSPVLETHMVDFAFLNTSRIILSDFELYKYVTMYFLPKTAYATFREVHVINIEDTSLNPDWSQDYGIFSSTCAALSMRAAGAYVDPMTNVIIGCSIAGALFLVIFAGTVIGLWWWQKKKRMRLFREIHEDVEEHDEGRRKFQIPAVELEIDYDEVMGKGSTSIVYKAFLKSKAPLCRLLDSDSGARFSNCNVAVKVPNTYTYEEIVVSTKELEAYKRLKYHEDILACLGWMQLESRRALVFEIALGGDLRKYVMSLRDQPTEEFNEKEFLYIFRQICLGMAYVASCGMVHRDLAARNVLLTADKRAKISDFGLCCDCDETFTYTATLSKRLPIRWLSLEALVDRVFSEKSDVWSFGCSSTRSSPRASRRTPRSPTPKSSTFCARASASSARRAPASSSTS